jgi:hypothetical protein
LPQSRVCIIGAGPRGMSVLERICANARQLPADARINMCRATDPLLRHLYATGQCRWHVIPDPGGVPHESGGLAVTERPYRLVDAAGMPHPARYALGVPTESVHWVTAAGIRPAVNSVTLADSDAVALTVLGLATTEERADEAAALQIGA